MRLSWSHLAQLVLAPALVIAACTDRTPTDPLDHALRAARAAGKTTGPTVSSTSPNTSPRNVTLDVRVLGSGFDRGSKAQWALKGVPSTKVVTNSTKYVSSKELVANITIAADADVALYDVIVTTSSGKPGIGTEMFAITEYSVQDIGTVAGIPYAEARAVNDQGVVVGKSEGGYVGSPYQIQGFAWLGGQMVALTASDDSSSAYDISDGAAPYVGGQITIDGQRLPARWRLSTSPLAVTETLVLDTVFGTWINGVNELGDVIGKRIRLSDGTILEAAPPRPGFTVGYGIDINNARHAVFAGGEGGVSLYVVRLSSGQTVVLDPPANNPAASTIAKSLSEVVTDSQGRSVIFLAGTAGDQPARWVVDVTNGTLLSVDVVSQSGTAWGVDAFGNLSGYYGPTWSINPFVWRNDEFSKLPLPAGLTQGEARGMSASGRYIAGKGSAQNDTRALLWIAH